MNQLKGTTRPRTPRPLRLLAVALASFAIAAGIVVPTSAAVAADGFVSPVSGNVADIVGGCPAGSRPTHEGVDINGNGGTNVYAAAGGQIQTAVNSSSTSGYGSQIVIVHPGGYTTRYAHMVNGSVTLTPGTPVNQGTLLGKVGSTGNSTGPHMHFEIKLNGNNVTNLYFSCGQGSVAALQPLGAGPVTPAVTDRSFSLTSTGTLQGKAGMYEPVVALRNNIVAFDADGTTIAAVDTSGNVWVQQGSFTNGWVGLSGQAKDVAVDGDRFVVLKTDGTVIAKDGLYSTAWLTQLAGVEKIDAADGRLGVLKGGSLFVKEGNLQAGWVDQGGGVSDFALDGTRIGIISGGTAYVKEGNLYTAWVTMRNGSRVELEGSRIAVLTPDGIVTVKEGTLWSSWVNLTGPGVGDLSLSGNRVAVLSGGSVLIKTGALNATWIGAFANSKAIKIS